MRRLHWLCLALLLLTRFAQAETVVYEISKGNNKLFLAGTIHILRAQDFPLPTEFELAYAASEKIFFETNLTVASSPEFSSRLMQSLMLPAGTTLKDTLSASTWQNLDAYAQANQISLDQFSQSSAGLLSLVLTMNAAKKMGMGEGVDAYFDKKSRNDNKYIGELESADDVIAYMKEYSREDPNKIINSTLNDLSQLDDNIKQLMKAWRAGDLVTLQNLMGAPMQKEVPVIYEALLINRNKKWLPHIEQMLKTSEVEMVLVGSLHLAGDNGLLALLKKDGYQVKPVSKKG